MSLRSQSTRTATVTYKGGRNLCRLNGLAIVGSPLQVMSLCACLDKQDVLLQACNLGARSCAAALYVY